VRDTPASASVLVQIDGPGTIDAGGWRPREWHDGWLFLSRRPQGPAAALGKSPGRPCIRRRQPELLLIVRRAERAGPMTSPVRRLRDRRGASAVVTRQARGWRHCGTTSDSGRDDPRYVQQEQGRDLSRRQQ
jgi:hypothetical protein